MIGINETPRSKTAGYQDYDTALRGEGDYGTAASCGVLNPSFHKKTASSLYAKNYWL